MLNNDVELFWTAIATTAGSLIALVVYFFYGGSRRPIWIRSRSPKWCVVASGAVGSTAFAYGMHLERFSFLLLFVAVPAVLFGKAIWLFFKERQQFTLRSLLFLTLGIAALCSLSYVPIAPVIVVVALPMSVWLRLR